jgi:hypothetical protein
MRFAALRRLGLRKNAVGLVPFMRFFPATFFVRWNCFAIPLSRTKKRRIQPKRYAPFFEKLMHCIDKVQENG